MPIPASRQLFRQHASDLSRNPRQIKRFINVFRFYALIQFRRKLRGLPALSYEQVGKLAVIAVRWPHLLNVLGRPGTNGNGSVLSHLESLAVEAEVSGDPAAAWRKCLEQANLTDRLRRELAAAELQPILARPLAIGASAESFL
jgi:hypothetical protein